MKIGLKKFALGLFALPLLSAQLFGTQYIFKGTEGADVTNASNYYQLTQGSLNFIWASEADNSIYPSSYESTSVKKYADATSAPGINDTVAFQMYTIYSYDSDNKLVNHIEYGAATISIKDSWTVGEIFSRRSGGVALSLGSTTSNEAFVLKTTKRLAFGYTNGGSIVIADGATNSSFEINIGTELRFEGTSNIYNIGSTGKYFDKVSVGSLALPTKTFDTFVKEFDITGAANIRDVKWNFHISENTLSAAESLITIGGALSKVTGKIVFDFSDVETAALSGTYDLITADSVSGFDAENPLTDFELIGIDASKTPTLNWNDKTLQINFGAIPEPASFALLFGFGAMLLLYMRKKNR